VAAASLLYTNIQPTNKANNYVYRVRQLAAAGGDLAACQRWLVAAVAAYTPVQPWQHGMRQQRTGKHAAYRQPGEISQQI